MSYALITGASKGIGAEFARLFARDGTDLVVCSSPRSRAELAVFAAELEQQYGIRVHPLTEDLSVPGGAGRLIEQVEALGVEIDYLVNNAGAGIVGLPVQEYEIGQFVAMLELNVVTLSELSVHFVRPMVQRRRGRILNISSSAGYVVPHGLEGGYSASKAYVISFSEATAFDLRGTGVTCTHLAPGPTKTNFFQAAGLVDERRMARLGFSSPGAMAKIGYEAMHRGKRGVLPGLSNKLVTWAARVSVSKTITGKISAWVVSRDLG
ncbi:SDR family NAD(P)-dependent oxidoreductase [Variovorax sp. AFSI2.2]|uniref:SDR family NAD(P)-dependent oxidoreductase n=1 Tax=Variovorax sp. AFSI2.2 TaxID=3384160 RepID=UPI003EC0BF77